MPDAQPLLVRVRQLWTLQPDLEPILPRLLSVFVEQRMGRGDRLIEVGRFDPLERSGHVDLLGRVLELLSDEALVPIVRVFEHPVLPHLPSIVSDGGHNRRSHPNSSLVHSLVVICCQIRV
jgi:hypothetical protein